MPDAPEPESLVPERELIERVLDQIPPDRQKWLVTDSPFEVRRAEPVDWIKPTKRPPHRMVWYRIADELPDDPQLQRYLLAYAADFNMIGTALQAHGVSWMSRGMQVASLDHAMWFHRPFRLENWVLHVMESPNATAARALIQGRFYTRDGALIATTTQEALIRRWE
jgi:acyl-CoA thioesterase-2